MTTPAWFFIGMILGAALYAVIDAFLDIARGDV
jgi:hypothetical protein